MATTSARTRKASTTDAVPQIPQSIPAMGGGGDYSPVVWQQLGDIQKTLGRLESSVEKLRDDVAKVEQRLESTNEKLSGVTHKIYAATAVLIIAVGIGSFIMNKAWDMMQKIVLEEVATAKAISPVGVVNKP